MIKIERGLKVNGKFFSDKIIETQAMRVAKGIGLKPLKSVMGDTPLKQIYFIKGALRR